MAITRRFGMPAAVCAAVLVWLTAVFAQPPAPAALAAGPAPVSLGTAAAFAVLASSTVTNTGVTTVTGDLGLSPGTAVTGFPPGVVTGTIHAADAASSQAQLDLTTAYNDAAGRTGGTLLAGNLGGQTLTPGLYTSTSSLEVSSGDLTLDAQGDINAIFVFQMASTFTMTTGRQVILTGGATAANVIWQVGSSATLGTGAVFKGNILALASITVMTGAAVEGRLLARTGAVTLDTNTVAVPGRLHTDAVGVFRPSDGTFYLDYNGSGTWEGCGTDRCLQIGMNGDVPLVGDWNGSGTSKVGAFRPSDGTFYLDYNGSGTWEGCGIDRCLQIGMNGDIPLVGDWNGSGTTKVGAFRPTDGTFYLDYNGSGTWEGCGVDRCLQIGMLNDTPLVGDWNGSGTAKVGVFRPSDGTFYLDYNGDGAWNGCGTDRCLQIGMLNDTPLVGDWNGTGTSKVGVFRPSDGTFYLDYNGSGTWEGCGTDRCLQIGMLNDTPLVGDWNGSGTAKVGVFRPSDGTFYLDYDGSGTWDGCGTDRCLQIGMSGDTPLVGKW